MYSIRRKMQEFIDSYLGNRGWMNESAARSCRDHRVEAFMHALSASSHCTLPVAAPANFRLTYCVQFSMLFP
jgi:hypothetical protein